MKNIISDETVCSLRNSGGCYWTGSFKQFAASVDESTAQSARSALSESGKYKNAHLWDLELSVNNHDSLLSALKGCRDMLNESAKQFRNLGDSGHAVMCERHRDNAQSVLETDERFAHIISFY